MKLTRGKDTEVGGTVVDERKMESTGKARRDSASQSEEGVTGKMTETWPSAASS